MKICKTVSSFLRLFDLLPVGQFLRYRGEADYRTMTGGVTSLIVIAFFCLQFGKLGLQTVDKEIINSSSSTSYSSNPAELSFSTDPKQGFMFGVGIELSNLSNPAVKLFDVTLKQRYWSTGYTFVNSTDIPLVTCTQEHFSFNQQSRQLYHTLVGSTWLCPSLSQDFTIKGKSSSEQFIELALEVKRCNQTTDASCANDTAFEQAQAYLGGQFTVGFPVVSTFINAGDQKYTQIVLQDRNIFTFTDSRATEAVAYIEETTVNTDQSLTPIESIKTQKFLTARESFHSKTMEVTNSTFMKVSMRRSPISTTYTRSFNKYDNFLSYVGGLIGSFVGLLFMVNLYNEKAYSISFGSQVFTAGQGQQISSFQFHIGYFFTSFIQSALSFCGCCSSFWNKTMFYQECLEQIDEQLDIVLIIKRLTLLERAMTTLLSPAQIEALHLIGKQSLEDARIRRKMFTLPERIHLLQEEEDSEKSSSKNAVFPDPVYVEELSADSISKVRMSSKDHLKKRLLKVQQEADQGNLISKRIIQRLGQHLIKDLQCTSEVKKSQVVHRESILEEKQAEKRINDERTCKAQTQIIKQAGFSRQNELVVSQV